MLEITLENVNVGLIRNENMTEDVTEFISYKAGKLMEEYLNISLPANWTSLSYE